MDIVDSLPHQMHLMHSDVIQPYPRMGKDTLEKYYGTLMQVAMNCSYSHSQRIFLLFLALKMSLLFLQKG